MATNTVSVRRANAGDQAVLVEFNRRMAWETEKKILGDAAVGPGVGAVLADPAKGFYLVAESAGEVVGQLLITSEWSDWRNGYFWWIQSVFVPEDARRRGIFGCLYREVERIARAAGNVIGIRLYVERNNAHAQKAYERLGMTEEPYLIYGRHF